MKTTRLPYFISAMFVQCTSCIWSIWKAGLFSNWERVFSKWAWHKISVYILWSFPWKMVVPPKHPKMIIFKTGKPMVVGYHHFRNPPYIYIILYTIYIYTFVGFLSSVASWVHFSIFVFCPRIFKPYGLSATKSEDVGIYEFRVPSKKQSSKKHGATKIMRRMNQVI